MPKHPITTSDELVQEWTEEYRAIVDGSMYVEEYIVIQTSRFRQIADAELEACISAVLSHPGFEQPELFVELLRAARRPKPPSLAEQALALVSAIERSDEPKWDFTVIHRALERLQELENNG